MTTSFRHDRNKSTRARNIKIAGALIFLSIFLLSPASHFLSGAIHQVARPIWYTRDFFTQTFRTTIDGFRSKQALAEQNRVLQDRIAEQEATALLNASIRVENESLREKLGRHSEEDLILARVIAAPGITAYDTLIIDAGSNLGLIPGLRISADGDYAIGTIREVYRNSSVVELYSTPGKELDVTIGTSSISGVAHGEGGGNFVVQLPKAVPVGVGDPVKIPMLAPTFIGTIEGIDRPDVSSFQTLYLRLPFPVSNITTVYVSIPKEPENIPKASS
jgi:cell shape-determining protein MreC